MTQVRIPQINLLDVTSSVNRITSSSESTALVVHLNLFVRLEYKRKTDKQWISLFALGCIKN